MTYRVLINEKKYTVPGKCITWSISRGTLDLNVILNWVKYESGELLLPPIELGYCKEWHFELSDNISSVKFIAKWAIRSVKDKLQLIDVINENIIPYALNLE